MDDLAFLARNGNSIGGMTFGPTEALFTLELCLVTESRLELPTATQDAALDDTNFSGVLGSGPTSCPEFELSRVQIGMARLA